MKHQRPGRVEWVAALMYAVWVLVILAGIVYLLALRSC